MLYILPVSNDPKQKFTTELNDTAFVFKIRYNTRAGRWFLSMYDEAESPIFEGVAINLGINYLDIIKDERLVEAVLFLFNFENETAEPTRDNFGETILLCYEDLT